MIGPLDRIVPPPLEVSRRGWEAAYDLLQAGELVDDALQHHCWLVTKRDPNSLSWREIAALFRAHRRVFPARAA